MMKLRSDFEITQSTAYLALRQSVAPSHHLTQYWFIVSWTFLEKDLTKKIRKKIYIFHKMHLSTKVAEVAPPLAKSMQEYQLVHVITSATKQLPMLDVLWENCCHWVVNVIEVDLISKFLQKTYFACNRAFWTGLHDESSNKYMASHGPLTRYIKLRVAHAPGVPRKFSLSPTSKETDS